MTPAEIMALGASRASWNTGNVVVLDRARQYLNGAILALQNWDSVDWWFRFKVFTLTMVTDQANYDLDASAQLIFNARNTTDNRPIDIMSPTWLDDVDPDSSETGNVVALVPLGLNSSTGAQVVRAFRIPDAADSISYRAWVTLPKVVVSGATGNQINDSEANLEYYIPEDIQDYLWYEISARFFASKGAFIHAREERREGQNIIKGYMNVNAKTLAGMKVVMGEKNSLPLDESSVTFTIGTIS